MTRKATTAVLAVVTAGLGVALVVRTAAAGGGGGLGYLVGALFVLAGAARLYMATR